MSERYREREREKESEHLMWLAPQSRKGCTCHKDYCDPLSLAEPLKDSKASKSRVGRNVLNRRLHKNPSMQP